MEESRGRKSTQHEVWKERFSSGRIPWSICCFKIAGLGDYSVSKSVCCVSMRTLVQNPKTQVREEPGMATGMCNSSQLSVGREGRGRRVSGAC